MVNIDSNSSCNGPLCLTAVEETHEHCEFCEDMGNFGREAVIDEFLK